MRQPSSKKPRPHKKRHKSRTAKKSKRPPSALLAPQGQRCCLAPAPETRLPTIAPDIAETNGLLVAIDTPYQIFDNQGSYVHVAAWGQNGQPAKGAHVYIGMNHVAPPMTTASWRLSTHPKDPQTGQRATLTGGSISVVDAQDEARRGEVHFAPSVRTASFATDQLYVYTDRGVYRPGDTVRVRAIAWHLKDDYSALEEVDIEFQLKDASGRLLGGATQTTTRFAPPRSPSPSPPPQKKASTPWVWPTKAPDKPLVSTSAALNPQPCSLSTRLDASSPKPRLPSPPPSRCGQPRGQTLLRAPSRSQHRPRASKPSRSLACHHPGPAYL